MQEKLKQGDPRRLGNYKIIARLGEGGAATVFLAESPEFGTVALKVLHPQLSTSKAVRDRLEQEAIALTRVSGKRVVKVLDVNVTGTRPYIALEYVDGHSLQTEIETKSISGAYLDTTLRAIAEALSEIHRAGVIHRDLKPSNILIGASGIKVVDFGISALDDVSQNTRTGVFVGTPGWISPEQATDAELTAATDVFNFGLVAAYAATGVSPFGKGRPEALLYRIVNEEPDLSALPKHLQALVASCLQKDPKKRPTIQKVAKQLQGVGAADSDKTVNASDATVMVSKTEFDRSILSNNSNGFVEKVTGWWAGLGRESRILTIALSSVVALLLVGFILDRTVMPIGGPVELKYSVSSTTNPYLSSPKIIVTSGEKSTETVLSSSPKTISAGNWRFGQPLTIEFQSGFVKDQNTKRTFTPDELRLWSQTLGTTLVITVDATDYAVTLKSGNQVLMSLTRGNETAYKAEQKAGYDKCVKDTTTGWQTEMSAIVNFYANYQAAWKKYGFASDLTTTQADWSKRAYAVGNVLFAEWGKGFGQVPSTHTSKVSPYPDAVIAAAGKAMEAEASLNTAFDDYGTATAGPNRGSGLMRTLFSREWMMIDLYDKQLSTAVTDLNNAISSGATSACKSKFPGA